MTTKHFCDRCEIETPNTYFVPRHFTDGIINHELCNDCLEQWKIHSESFFRQKVTPQTVQEEAKNRKLMQKELKRRMKKQ